MTSGVLDTTFYATYKKWLLYRTQDLNLSFNRLRVLISLFMFIT